MLIKSFNLINFFKRFQKDNKPDINVPLLQKMIDKGYVIVSKHPTAGRKFWV